MARQKRHGRKHLPPRKKSAPLLADEDFAARMGLSPFQWTVQQLALVLACASVCLHAFITLCYGVAPVFVGAPVSLMGLPALVWLVADGVWAWALVCTLRRRWGPPRDLSVDPRSAWRYGGGFCLAAVAVGLAVTGAWQPLWRGLAGAGASWPLWPVQVALPVCLPLAREPWAGWAIAVAFGALVVSVVALKWLAQARVFLVLMAVSLAAFAAWVWGEACVRFAGARGLAGVVLPAIQAEALAAPADFNAWVWALWWTGVLLWLAAASAAAGVFHLPRVALEAMRQRA